MAAYEYKTQIRFNEINENNELSDKGLLNILSEAAGLHSEEVGYGLNTKKETNRTWMILYWKVRIFQRPKWKTELTIKTWPSEFNRVVTWREFEVYDKQGEQIAIASTQWVSIDAQNGSVLKITEELINEYGLIESKPFKETPNAKIKEPEDMEKTYEYTTTRRDMDTNHHVNNVIYLEFAYNALPKDISINFENLEIYYKKQIKIGETINCFYKQEGDSHIIAIKSQDEKTLHAILKFY